MEEADIEEDGPSQISQNERTQQIISIRKKLAAPNDILPGQMIRSQLPVHLLPVAFDFQFQPGHQMLLAQVETNELESLSDHKLSQKLKNNTIKTRGQRSKSEFVPTRDREKVIWPSYSHEYQEKGDPLSFLGRSLKNVLSFPEEIAFISKTALLGHTKESSHLKAKILNSKDHSEINQLYLRYLRSLDLFAVATYAYDQCKNQQIDRLPKFQPVGDLQFDDDFESSNLYLAMNANSYLPQERKVGEDLANVYLAVVRFDYNTKSYGQWFYFKVKRAEKPFSFSRDLKKTNFYKFLIINMTKSSSMFGKGLKISVCRNGVWRKEGLNIQYKKNSLIREDLPNIDSAVLLTSLKQKQYFYTLEFTLQIFQGEEIYVSYNQPYTYSRIGRTLDSIVSRYETNRRNIIDLRRYVICKTFLNNSIQVVSFSVKVQQQFEAVEEKKIIFIMGRCHPVETAGSHVAEGILSTLSSLFLQSPLEEQKNHIVYKLLQNYVVKIIPMVNPDGVILGNSRCNIAGFDLNRSWRNTKTDRSKEIYQIKKYILQYRHRIAMFIDLHAHSKKKNVFAYGCHDITDPFSTRQFPFLLSKLSENDFLFSQCRFTRLTGNNQSQKGSKEGTARVFLYDFLKIPNIFTIQNSYCSAKNSIFHYDKAAYELIGGDILKAISLYFSPTFKASEQWKSYQQNYFEMYQASQKLNNIQSDLNFEGEKILNISLNETMNEIEVKVKMKKKDLRLHSLMGLREQFIHQLRGNEENVKMGLQKDEVSESEEEERVYNVQRKYKTQSVQSLRNKKQPKINEKLIPFLNKTRTVEQSKIQDLSPRQKTLRNVHSTQSEINLIKMPSSTGHNRFNTLNKIQETAIEPFQNERGRLLSPSKQMEGGKKHLNESIFRSTKKNQFLSVIEIGLEKETNITHNYHLNLVQKIQSKFPQTHRLEEGYKGVRFEPQAYLNRKKEAEIKDYLRKLVRPKQLLEKRRQRVGMKVDRAQKKEMRLKQSNIEFSEGRLTRLLTNQGAYSRMMTDQVRL